MAPDRQRRGEPGDCHSLWIGSSIPPLARACLQSFLRHGHRVFLHSYAPIPTPPAGVEVLDASRIVPEEKIVRHHRSGSVSLFSNYFRYKLSDHYRGFWIDCDVYCLRHFDFADTLVLGWESDATVNGAVLRLEPGSALQRDAIALFESPRPSFPWFAWDQILRARLRSLLHRKPLICFLPWGAAGPRALTWLVAKHGLQDRVQPVPVFYPLPYSEARRLRERAFDPRPLFTRETVAMHLWNEQLAQGPQETEPGSFLDRLEREAAGGEAALAAPEA